MLITGSRRQCTLLLILSCVINCEDCSNITNPKNPDNIRLKQKIIGKKAWGKAIPFFEFDNPISVQCEFHIPVSLVNGNMIVLRFIRIPEKNLDIQVKYLTVRRIANQVWYDTRRKKRKRKQRKRREDPYLSLNHFETVRTDARQCKLLLFSMTVVMKQKDFSGTHFCELSARKIETKSRTTIFRHSSEPLTISSTPRTARLRVKPFMNTFGSGVSGDNRLYFCSARYHGSRPGQMFMTLDSAGLLKDEVETSFGGNIMRVMKTFSYTIVKDGKWRSSSKPVFHTIYAGAKILDSIDDEKIFMCKYTVAGYESKTKTKENKIYSKPHKVRFQPVIHFFTISYQTKETHIICKASGYPRPICTISFTSDRIPPIQIIKKGKYTSQIILNNNTMSGEYKVKCVCKNSFGERSNTHDFVVLKRDPAKNLPRFGVKIARVLLYTILFFAALYLVIVHKKMEYFKSSSAPSRNSMLRKKSSKTAVFWVSN